MNKKKLSVVMAGAMLASSVAPVLAATESELDTSRLGSLVEKVHEQLTSKVFDKTDAKLANKSVYYVKINDKDAVVNGTAIKDMPITTDAEKEALRLALQEAFKGLTAGDKVEIYSHGFREDKDGKLFSETEAVIPKYELKTVADNVALEKEIKDTFAKLNLNYSPISEADGAKFDTSKEGELRITFAKKLDLTKMSGYTVENSGSLDTVGDTLVLKAGDVELDFTHFYGNSNDTPIKFAATTTRAVVKGFPKVEAKADEIKDILEETIKITGVQHNYKTEELYDGLMLTTTGHELLSLVKDVRRDGKKDTTAVIKDLYGKAYSKGDTINLEKKDGEFGFILIVKDAFGKTTEYTVKGAEKQTNILASWLNNELAKVDILAGDNRYETAVSIAKEQVGLVGTGTDRNNGFIDNIVLVNGKSLVDGLSAAPLAAKLTAGNGIYKDIAAPVLLSESDELPRATKLYLKELQANKIIGNNKKATIHLVGGTTVLTRNLERELEDLGFVVKRYNGANREETSLKVAEAVGTKGKELFVVGAEGEADAMSIAGVASREKAPIIVSKKGGLTYDALKALEDEKVTVLGGEKSVSSEDFEAIKEEASAVRRISGENRQGTNAAIIKTFYYNSGVNTSKSVIVAKDGKGNNGQLVDALTAANLGAQTNAPVVLATSSLSEDQLDALQLRGKSADSLYQVGIGVERPVVETIASKLGLLNK